METRRPLLWYVTTIASIAVGVVPIWVLEHLYGVPRKISVGYGFLAWAIGVTGLKLPAYRFIVERLLAPRMSRRALAVTQGLVSGVSELSAAAAFFVFIIPDPSFWQLVGFGVGAGAVEAIILPFIGTPFKGTSLEEHEEEVIRAAAPHWGVQALSVLERVWAMCIHVSTRGLVYFSVASGNPLPACVALAGFVAGDGVAYYWHLTKVCFDSARVLLAIHLYVATLAGALLGAFWVWAEHFPFPAG